MFKVTIIKLKDILKCLIILILIVVFILVVKGHFFDNIKQTNSNSEENKEETAMILKNILNLELPVISKKENDDTNELIDENTENADDEFFTKLIGLELGIVNFKERDNQETYTNYNIEDNEQNSSEDNDNQENNDAPEDNEESDNLELAQKDVTTEVVTKEPIKEVYTDKVNEVKIKNETNFELTNDITNTDDLDIDTSNILIFHTHTCESYTSSEKYTYTATGNFRTTDLNYTVARVGDELTNYLTKYNFNVIHDKTYHDYPAYTGSYTRSLTTVTNLLKTNQSDIIIDLHRDAIGSNSAYAPTVKIGDDYCAQIMFVIGSNGGGLSHSNWKSNLQFAIKLQEKANELYPGLFKPIILRNSRYNQHLGKAACIIEVGATGNTLDECLNSMKYLSKVMNSCFQVTNQ